MRVGFGYDSHRFSDERKSLVLGGVEFPGEAGLKAHSDGDVVIHALIDALLGGAAQGDIGELFPDTDERWRGANSVELLKVVVEKIAALGYSVGNVDITIICEKPKIGPKREMIRKRLAEILSVDVGCVSVKGKTNEKMDDVGAGMGIEVHAVALLK